MVALEKAAIEMVERGGRQMSKRRFEAQFHVGERHLLNRGGLGIFPVWAAFRL